MQTGNPFSFASFSDGRGSLEHQAANRLLQPKQRILQNLAGTGEIEPLKAFSSSSENIAFITEPVSLLGHKLFKSMKIHSQGAKIQPLKIGPLELVYADLREVFRHKMLHQFFIALQMNQQLLQPFFTAGISQFTGFIGHDVQCKVSLSSRNLFTVFGIGNQNIGGLKAGQIEGFAGRSTDRAVLKIGVGEGCQRDMLKARHNQIKMDLVGKDEYMMAQADFAELQQLVPAPDPSYRIMGTA